MDPVVTWQGPTNLPGGKSCLSLLKGLTQNPCLPHRVRHHHIQITICVGSYTQLIIPKILLDKLPIPWVSEHHGEEKSNSLSLVVMEGLLRSLCAGSGGFG